MAEDMGEKTESPSGRKLGEARNRGQVVKSTELAGAIDLIGATVLLAFFGGPLVAALGKMMRRMLEAHASVEAFDLHAIHAMMIDASGDSVIAAAPLIAAIVLVACLSQLVQVGFLFTTQPLEPKFDRLDPVAGFKRLFGLRGVVKTAMNTSKVALILLVGSAVIFGVLTEVISLPNLPMTAALREVVALGGKLAAWLLVIMLVLGAIDYAYQRWQFMKDLRMTKQEVKEERKDMEGDPEMKGKRLRMAREIALQRVNSAVPTADVIVTNPTHFSVAIKYDQDTMRAPVVVAKGADEIALRIRQVARNNDVPVVERPPLARALYYGVDVGREISPEHYQAVAEILAYVYRLEAAAA